MAGSRRRSELTIRRSGRTNGIRRSATIGVTLNETDVPLPDDSVAMRCNEFTRLHRLDPGGTALAPNVLVLAEVPEPWPKPAARQPVLAALTSALTGYPETTRLLAAIPRAGTAPRIIAFHRSATGLVRREVPLDDAPEEALARVMAADQPGVTEPVGEGPTTLLVCTQGTHDVCCGTDGAAFAAWVGADRPGIELFRVSHTGGHRFAPTAMTLPDGRMWAQLDPVRLDGIIARTTPAAEAAQYCRGWWGAATGPAQIAERAVFAELGWDVDRLARSVRVEDSGLGDLAASVETSIGSWEVALSRGRVVPTIACEAPGGLPVKSSQEWIVNRIARLDD